MGEKNHAMCSYLAIPEIFADFINGVLFDGRCRMKEQDIQNQNSIYYEKIMDGRGKKIKLERERDVVKGIAKGKQYAVVGIENQNKVHYAMPFRCMEYEIAEYAKQLRFIRKNYKKTDGTGEEFLSKMSREQKLNPVVVILFYHEKGKYEGCTDLYGMLDLEGENEVYRQYITNYRVNLVTLEEIKEENFRSGLKQLFGVMKRSEDKTTLKTYIEENQSDFSNLDEETFDIMSTMVNQKDLKKYKERCRSVEGGIDMCKAINEIREEGIETGIKALIEVCRELAVSKEETVSKLETKFLILKEEAERYMNKYWKE